MFCPCRFIFKICPIDIFLILLILSCKKDKKSFTYFIQATRISIPTLIIELLIRKATWFQSIKLSNGRLVIPPVSTIIGMAPFSRDSIRYLQNIGSSWLIRMNVDCLYWLTLVRVLAFMGGWTWNINYRLRQLWSCIICVKSGDHFLYGSWKKWVENKTKLTSNGSLMMLENEISLFNGYRLFKMLLWFLKWFWFWVGSGIVMYS